MLKLYREYNIARGRTAQIQPWQANRHKIQPMGGKIEKGMWYNLDRASEISNPRKGLRFGFCEKNLTNNRHNSKHVCYIYIQEFIKSSLKVSYNATYRKYANTERVFFKVLRSKELLLLMTL